MIPLPKSNNNEFKRLNEYQKLGLYKIISFKINS